MLPCFIFQSNCKKNFWIILEWFIKKSLIFLIKLTWEFERTFFSNSCHLLIHIGHQLIWLLTLWSPYNNSIDGVSLCRNALVTSTVVPISGKRLIKIPKLFLYSFEKGYGQKLGRVLNHWSLPVYREKPVKS